jgi:hypothetical protein
MFDSRGLDTPNEAYGFADRLKKNSFCSNNTNQTIFGADQNHGSLVPHPPSFIISSAISEDRVGSTGISP